MFLPEMRDHVSAVLNAKGDCLVNGLGLGMVVQAMLFKDGVNTVTVIERSPDVIKLVAPHYQERFGKRFTVIESDALQYVPPRGKKYGAVWHDIWDYICADNLDESTAPSLWSPHRVAGFLVPIRMPTD